MKYLIVASLGVVVGIIAGSWGPREDLAALRERTESAKNVRKASDASGFGAFAKMVNIPDVAKRPKGKAKAEVKGKPEAKAAATATNAVARQSAAADSRAADRPAMSRLSRADLRARIDEAADLWRTRVELAKTQWKAKLGIPEGEKSATFDNAIGSMNESLLETMTALAEEIEKAEKMTPELGLRLMGDASRVMAEAYDAIGEAVPPDRRGEVSELPVFEFIDPSVAEPLIGVQDKLEAVEWKGPRR